jgi:hypothetical protein
MSEMPMFASISSQKVIALAAAAGLATLATGSSALATITGPFIEVTATNASGSGTFSVPLGDVTMNPDGSAIFTLPAPVQIMSGPTVIAEITQMTSFVRPASGSLPNLISVGFAFFAGSSTTTFTVDSTLFCIDPIMNEAGRTSSGFTLTDMDGNGGTFAGQHAGGGSFNTYYNGDPPGGTVFASVLPGTSVGAFGTQTMNAGVPGGGLYLPLPDIADMSSRWSFTLTANDQIGATSVWEIIPAPGTFALIGLAGLTAARRSRR